jgi:hypothetical protein
MYPLDAIRPTDGIDNRVQAVPDHPVDPLCPGLEEDLDQLICERAHVRLPVVEVSR